MRKIALTAVLSCLIFSLCACQVAQADQQGSSSIQKNPFDQSLKHIADRVMIAIYEDIVSMKDEDDHLVDFDRRALYTNQYGIYTVMYEHKISDGMRKGEFLEFGVTIIRIEDTNFSEFGRQAFNFSFPLLGIKFAGYQRTDRKWLKFDIQEIVRKNGDPLLEEQRKYLPLKLSLSTDKECFRVDEDVRVKVTIENVSSKNLWVKELEERTVHFLHANIPWNAVCRGKRMSDERKRFMLRPGQKIHKEFLGSGFTVPGEFEIYCSYIVTFKGVNLSSVMKVKVVE